MMYQNGYEQYKTQSINTMTRGEMLLLLFDELLKRLGRAEIALGDENYKLFEESVQRAKDIVKYLNATLNPEYGISSQLRRMYDFFSYELNRLQIGRNQKVIEELKPLISELRDAFKEADKKSKV